MVRRGEHDSRRDVVPLRPSEPDSPFQEVSWDDPTTVGTSAYAESAAPRVVKLELSAQAIAPRTLKIENVETFLVDAGWRPWAFVKITTDAGIVGWGEASDPFTQFAVLGAIEDMRQLLIGTDPLAHELRFWDMYRRSRLGSVGGAVGKAIGAIECALVDIKAKVLGVSVAQLFGGPLRERVPLYWSHFVTNRILGEKFLARRPIRKLSDIATAARDVAFSGYGAVKTNLIMLDETPTVDWVGYMPGAGNMDGRLSTQRIRQAVEQMTAIREVIGPNIELILDVNFNLKPEAAIQLIRALEPARLAWIELDIAEPDALAQVKASVETPICSLETLIYTEQYKPYFDRRAVDIVMIDTLWNGFVQAKKVGELAQLYQLNICPHNYYSHLSTFIAAQLCAVLPNVRTMEFDVEDVPWRDDLVTRSPEILGGELVVPLGPGWGTDIEEAEVRRRPWGGAGKRSQITVPTGTPT